jgi:hypothetical protein
MAAPNWQGASPSGLVSPRRVHVTCAQKALVCAKLQHALGFSPIAIGHDAVVKSRDHWMLELNACNKSLEWRHEAARAVMFEGMPGGH